MNETISKIKNIVTFNDFKENKERYMHLFEVQIPNEHIKLFKERTTHDLGTLMVGDLVLDLERERLLEIHPFPEWVVQLKTIKKTNAKPYLIVPNFSLSFMKKFLRKSLDSKIELIKEQTSGLKIEELIAFEYQIGINVLVHAYVPHFFISSKIKKKEGEVPPYLQVFEPNYLPVVKTLNIKPSYYFKLPYYVEI
ncbi:MAG: hypothetical protein ACTSXH_01200 [Promethearchaeota archaeon]